DAKAVVKTSVKPEMLNRNVETFTIGINNIDNNFAHLEIMWEKTLAAVRFDVPTQKAALASIEKALAGPTASDYFSSAQYFYQSEGDMNKALTYVNKPIELSEQKPFY